MATHSPVFLPGESQGRGSPVGCHLWGSTESNTTEATQQQQHVETFKNCKTLQNFKKQENHKKLLPKLPRLLLPIQLFLLFHNSVCSYCLKPSFPTARIVTKVVLFTAEFWYLARIVKHCKNCKTQNFKKQENLKKLPPKLPRLPLPIQLFLLFHNCLKLLFEAFFSNCKNSD